MTDEELVARYRAGDDDAFRELVERLAPSVHRLVSSILGPFRDLDADETTQEVFLRMHAKLDQFDGRSKFATWLYRLAFNVTANHSQRARFRIPHDGAEVLGRLVVEGSQHAEAVAAERAAIIAAELESLPDLYRTAIYLHYWQETPVSDIAELLAIPVNTVKSYLLRARTRLGDALARRGITHDH